MYVNIKSINTNINIPRVFRALPNLHDFHSDGKERKKHGKNKVETVREVIPEGAQWVVSLPRSIVANESLTTGSPILKHVRGPTQGISHSLQKSDPSLPVPTAEPVVPSLLQSVPGKDMMDGKKTTLD